MSKNQFFEKKGPFPLREIIKIIVEKLNKELPSLNLK